MDTSFFQVAEGMSSKQKILVDQITKDSPILRALPMQATSKGLHNVYEEILSIDPVEQVDLDSDIPEVGIESDLTQVDIAKFAGKMTVGMDKLESLQETVKAYFARKTPTILAYTGEKLEYALIYNMIRAKAYAAGKLLDAGGTGAVNCTMLAVRFEPGENTGLYDPARGQLFKIEAYNGGNFYDITKNGHTYPGYAQLIRSYFGMQLAAMDKVSGIVNIDLTLSSSVPIALPTAYQIDDMLDDCKANAGNTLIMCHPIVRNYIAEKHTASFRTMTMTEGGRTFTMDSWLDIPFLTSRNFAKSTEAKVTI